MRGSRHLGLEKLGIARALVFSVLSMLVVGACSGSDSPAGGPKPAGSGMAASGGGGAAQGGASGGAGSGATGAVAAVGGSGAGGVGATGATDGGGAGADAGGAGGGGALDEDIATAVGEIDAGRIGDTITTLVDFGTRNTCSSTSSATSGVGAARDFIRAQHESAGLQVLVDDVSHSSCPGTDGKNVVAFIPGSDPTRLIVLSGHYDSLGGRAYADVTSPSLEAPGANDSGSQTAVLLEAARVLAGKTFVATLVFLSVTGEEQGLDGSADFAGSYTSLFSGATVEANLNMDIVGGDVSANDEQSLKQFRLYASGTPRERGGTAGGAEVMGTPDDTSPARGLMRYIEHWGKHYVPEMTMLPHLREDRPGRGSDHMSFLDRGIAAVRFIEARENFDHQHSPLDTLANMTPEYTARVAKVVTAVAASLARAPSAPTALEATGSTTSITLGWTAPSGGAVDHYVVAGRSIDENFYHDRVLVPAGSTSATVTPADLGVAAGSNLFVSVAAVGAAGHESLFAYPEYRCTSSGCEVQPGSLNVTQ